MRRAQLCLKSQIFQIFGRCLLPGEEGKAPAMPSPPSLVFNHVQQEPFAGREHRRIIGSRVTAGQTSCSSLTFKSRNSQKLGLFFYSQATGTASAALPWPAVPVDSGIAGFIPLSRAGTGDRESWHGTGMIPTGAGEIREMIPNLLSRGNGNEPGAFTGSRDSSLKMRPWVKDLPLPEQS